MILMEYLKCLKVIQIAIKVINFEISGVRYIKCQGGEHLS